MNSNIKKYRLERWADGQWDYRHLMGTEHDCTFATSEEAEGMLDALARTMWRRQDLRVVEVEK